MIQVLNGVKPKRGRLATGTYTDHGLVPIPGDAFGHKGQSVYPAPGDDFNVLSKGSGHPLGTFHNTATQMDVPAMAATRVGQQQSPVGRSKGNNFPDIQPHEHGKFFQSKQLTAIRHTGGPNKDHNTAFHPKKVVIQKPPKRKSAIAGERTSAASFPSHVRLLSDPRFQPHGGAGRWATVKRGAAG